VPAGASQNRFSRGFELPQQKTPAIDYLSVEIDETAATVGADETLFTRWHYGGGDVFGHF
jgi:hypothetical protein